MQTLKVALGERSYAIHVGHGLLGNTAELLPERWSRAVIVTNPIVASLHLDSLRNALSRAGIDHQTILVPDGEAHKSWSELNAIHGRLIELGAEPVISTPEELATFIRSETAKWRDIIVNAGVGQL